MTTGVIPERIEGETAKAYKGFVDFCQMGSGRSVPALWELYCHRDDTEPAPTKRLRTLKGWSADNDWQARVAEYERRAAEQREQERQRQRIEAETQVVEDSLSMLGWWRERQRQYHDTGKVPTMSYRELARLRREIDDLMRRSLGLPDRVTESTVKGTGAGGAVKVEHSGGVQVYIPDNGRDDRDDGD